MKVVRSTDYSDALLSLEKRVRHLEEWNQRLCNAGQAKPNLGILFQKGNLLLVLASKTVGVKLDVETDLGVFYSKLLEEL